MLLLQPSSTLFPYTTLFRSPTHTGEEPYNFFLAVAFPAGQEEVRSEEHTSELQSLTNLVCRLLLEKKKHTPIPCYQHSQPNPSPHSPSSDDFSTHTTLHTHS